MTCIIGFVDRNKDIYIGADSAGVANYSIRERTDSKVFVKGRMIFGFTSSFRMGQLIRYKFSIPEQLKSQDDYTYMCTYFIDELIKCFRDNGYAKVNDNEISGGFFLVGYNGNLYQIECDFQVAQINSDFDACGCGEEYAMGAMEVIESNLELKIQNPENKIIQALRVAEKFSAGVAGPFNIQKLNYSEECK